ncbi:DUF192 domain-containing protein [Caulobacter segnis]|uniref:DUF192 domain-containing protein n=1 Tax=Caulobacter segnis TaxID=88688 RepID=A0A2W5VBH8_9CAUL|nr:DUF192 domain-containing protein [Caulobacter segnis]PZR36632.1 MAG: DUF192 domain-containing protein [Caulobacter segnis]
MSGPRLSRRATLSLVGGAFGLGFAEAWAAEARLETVEVVTVRGRTRFQVEIAATQAEQARGLMFRKSLAADRGMLFTYKRPQPAAFWMKNTLIPLDIIFIQPDGRILSIVRNARPHDQTPLPSGGMVLGVLEIAGGRAAQLGILPGDRVLHRIFPK